VGSDRSCPRVTIGTRRIENPVVECFSTFETPKPREDLGRPSVGTGGRESRVHQHFGASGAKDPSPGDPRKGRGIIVVGSQGGHMSRDH
jgi:hypothetical protein